MLASMATFGFVSRLSEQAVAEEDWPYIVPSLLPALLSLVGAPGSSSQGQKSQAETDEKAPAADASGTEDVARGEAEREGP